MSVVRESCWVSHMAWNAPPITPCVTKAEWKEKKCDERWLKNKFKCCARMKGVQKKLMESFFLSYVGGVMARSASTFPFFLSPPPCAGAGYGVRVSELLWGNKLWTINFDVCLPPVPSSNLALGVWCIPWSINVCDQQNWMRHTSIHNL